MPGRGPEADLAHLAVHGWPGRKWNLNLLQTLILCPAVWLWASTSAL